MIASARNWPEIYEPDWLNSLGSYDVALADACGLSNKFLLARREPLLPIAMVGLQLANFHFIQSLECQWHLPFFLVGVKSSLNALALSLDDVRHVSFASFSPRAASFSSAWRAISSDRF